MGALYLVMRSATSGRMRVLMLFAMVLGLSGCLSAHKVRIESNPPGAIVSIRGEELGPTPIEITTLYFPYRWYNYGREREVERGGEVERVWRGGRTTVRIEAPGHRTGRVRMGRFAGRTVMADTLLFWLPDQFNGLAPWQWKWGHFNRLFGISPRHVHQVQLVRRHGRAGTWTPDDAERMK